MWNECAHQLQRKMSTFIRNKDWIKRKKYIIPTLFYMIETLLSRCWWSSNKVVEIDKWSWRNVFLFFQCHWCSHNGLFFFSLTASLCVCIHSFIFLKIVIDVIKICDYSPILFFNRVINTINIILTIEILIYILHIMNGRKKYISSRPIVIEIRGIYKPVIIPLK